MKKLLNLSALIATSVFCTQSFADLQILDNPYHPATVSRTPSQAPQQYDEDQYPPAQAAPQQQQPQYPQVQLRRARRSDYAQNTQTNQDLNNTQSDLDAAYSSNRYRIERPSDFHIVPTISYLNSNWSGYSNSNTSNYYNNYGYGGGSSGSISAKTGYAAGAMAVIGHDRLQYEIGLRYAERDVQYSGPLSSGNALANTPNGYTGNMTIKATYLEVPALVRYSFASTQETHFYVHGGVVVAALQSSSSSFDSVSNGSGYGYGNLNTYGTNSNYTPPGTTSDATLGTGLNTTDLRGTAGLGAEVRMTRGMSWIFQFDYEQSLAKINNSGSSNLVIVGYGLTTGVSFDL